MIKSVVSALAIATLALVVAPQAEAMPLASASPVKALPLAVPAIGAVSHDGLVHNVGHNRIRYRGHYVRGGISYFNGYRGIRYARHGYRHYKGYWYPRAAFSVTVRIGPRVVRPHRPAGPKIIHVNSQHVAWCQGRYKTYRASDNTYIPKVGYRAYCRSPYSR